MADASHCEVEATMGRSVYTLSEYATPGMLRLTRSAKTPDGEGVKSFYVPQTLVFRYLAEKILRESLLKLLEKFVT